MILPMLKRIFFFIKIFLLYILTGILGLVIPKDKDLTICISRKGKYYNGNNRALFEYMVEKEEKVLFIVNDKSLLNNLQKNLNKKYVDKIVYQYSFSGIISFLRAKNICITDSWFDLMGFFPSFWQNWIYLGHGIGTKALGNLKQKLTLRDKLVIFFRGKYAFAITSSEFDKYMFVSMYNISPKRVFITGYPRTDSLFNVQLQSKGDTILYAPTHREDEITELFPFPDFKRESIGKDLQKWNMELYLRFHPNNYKESRKEIADILKSSKRIIDKSPDIVQDVQDILPETDILVTDFSSISRDFLFLDRPMIFIMNGLEELGNLALPIRKEFAFCGYQVYTYKEFSDAIEEILNGKDRYVEVRKFVRDLHYNYFDNKSSERVANLIKELA